MTIASPSCKILKIIPYQELLGNYDYDILIRIKKYIIPYQELLGNYDPLFPRQ